MILQHAAWLNRLPPKIPLSVRSSDRSRFSLIYFPSEIKYFIHISRFVLFPRKHDIILSFPQLALLHRRRFKPNFCFMLVIITTNVSCKKTNIISAYQRKYIFLRRIFYNNPLLLKTNMFLNLSKFQKLQ